MGWYRIAIIWKNIAVLQQHSKCCPYTNAVIYLSRSIFILCICTYFLIWTSYDFMHDVHTYNTYKYMI